MFSSLPRRLQELGKIHGDELIVEPVHAGLVLGDGVVADVVAAGSVVAGGRSMRPPGGL
jgi:hypothetical protein